MAKPRTGSSVSVSVSPAHNTPGVVEISLSRVRAGCACVDAIPNMRLRKLCELPRGVRALLPKRAVYITSSSSPVSEFMDVVEAVSAYDGGGVSKAGRRGEDVDLYARNVVEREVAIGLHND